MAFVLVLAFARVASAHQTSVKYIDLVVDGTHVAITFRVAPGDVTEPMKLSADARPSVADAAATPAVAPYVARWLAIRSREHACEPTAPSAKPDDDHKFVAVTWSATCTEGTEELSLDFAGFFAVDKRHIAIIRLEGPNIEAADAIVRAGESPLVLRSGSTSLVAWIHAGMDHIYDGRDHISFVLALLLVVMLERRDRRWQLRRIAPTLRSTATVITAFTIAHSISLIAASLGWVDLPSRLVESLIALSIAYTAIENIVHPDVRWRFVLTFAFGLVHGLGFASQLAKLLPAKATVVPLLCFNVGVELGQLTIVLVALPVFYLLARQLGADRYRRIGMPVISGILCLAGLIWVIERVFQVTLLGM